MLRELHISNLAVIEDATVYLTAGLNVFTGQTGAGKSLVIGAFEALLGLRKAADMLRPGADEARIAGVFELHDPAVCRAVGAALDQTVSPGDDLLLTRKLFASGRSSLSVNGQPATAAMLARAAEYLVDIHGQHDHQHLLRPSHQLAILDGYAKTDALRERFAQRFAALRELRRTREELSASATLRRQQLELYEFQAEEIDAVEPTQGEFPELQARASVLGNVQKLKGEAGACHVALYEQDGSVTERLQHLAAVLMELAEVDPALGEVAEQVRTATLGLQETAFELSRYVDRLEHDPGEVEEVDHRLNALNRLISKYGEARSGDDPLAPVLSYRTQIAGEIQRLRGEDSDLGALDEQIAAVVAELEVLAAELSRKRKAAAKKLTPSVQRQLAELGMAEAKLSVVFARADDTPTGQDAVEFMVRTNPGQATRPLRQIASGGELSRVMLALKSVLSGRGRISVLVFDEIDANIGGRLGGVIGRKLRELAGSGAEAGHQVLCITHLPQIAAFGDRHFRIVKDVAGKGKTATTHTRVETLDGNARVDELAEMMVGQRATKTARKQAEELLGAAT